MHSGSQSAFSEQHGGDHYKGMAIQPAEYILANQLGWTEGVVVAYVSRWRRKGGLEDLKKAIHHLQMLIEHEETDRCPPKPTDSVVSPVETLPATGIRRMAHYENIFHVTTGIVLGDWRVPLDGYVWLDAVGRICDKKVYRNEQAADKGRIMFLTGRDE